MTGVNGGRVLPPGGVQTEMSWKVQTSFVPMFVRTPVDVDMGRANLAVPT